MPVLSLLLASTVTLSYQAPKSLPDRRAFEAAYGTLKRGWTQEDVEAALGRPDEVERARMYPPDPDGPSDLIWKYGVAKAGGCATLAKVEFRWSGRDYRLAEPHKRGPVTPGLPEEPTLRRTMQLIDDSAAGSSWFDDHFQPLAVLRAANALIRLGEAKGKSALREYFG